MLDSKGGQSGMAAPAGQYSNQTPQQQPAQQQAAPVPAAMDDFDDDIPF
jgi:single-stranded DNA-binding protein